MVQKCWWRSWVHFTSGTEAKALLWYCEQSICRNRWNRRFHAFLIRFNAARKRNLGNAGSICLWLGEVIGLEFHAKWNSMGQEVIERNHTALVWRKILQRISNMVMKVEISLAGAIWQCYICLLGIRSMMEINMNIAQFQEYMMRARFSSVQKLLLRTIWLLRRLRAVNSIQTIAGPCELYMDWSKFWGWIE